MAAELSASKVALAAISTGYGRLTLEEFAAGIKPIMESTFPLIEKVVLCLRSRDDAQVLSELLQ